MKITTQAFKDAISAPGRDLTATLLFPGRTFGVTEIKSVKTQENLLSGEDFEIGKAPKFSIDFEIWDRDKTLNFDFKDKEFTLLFGIKTYLDSDSNHSTLAQYTHEQLSQLIHGNIRFQGIEDVPFGIYKVTSADYKEGAYTVHAENRMSKAEVLYTDDGVYPKPVLQVVQKACELSGITLVNTVFANAGYSIPNAPVYEGITCRQIFAYASELAGGYAVINRTGELEIRTLGTATSRVIGKANYIELTETQDAIGNINKVIVRTGEQEAVQGIGTNMYTVQDNIFVQNPANVIAELYAVLSQVNYTALDLEWQGDFSLDIGDKVDVDGKATYLLNRTLDFQGGLRETYTSPAKNNVDKKSSGKQSMTVQIARVRTEIKVVDGKINQKITDDIDKFSEISQEIDNITQTVSNKADASDLADYSTKLQTATEISEAVVNKADKSEVTQLADSVTQTFTNQKIGGRNLIPNGGFEDGVNGVWTPHSGTETLEDGSANTKWDGKNLLIIAPPSIVNRGIFRIYDQFIVGKEYTFSAYVFAEDNLWMGVISNPTNIVPTGGQWKRFVCTFTATATSHPLYFLFNDSAELASAYIDNVMLQEGNKLTEFTPKEGEFATTTHKFNSLGYELKDNTGGSLITPNGMANEQNFGSTQNVEDGYPLNMSFRIGDSTSVITKVELRLKQYNFRTDSKGAASGGGSTSGPSSKSTTDERWTGQGLTAVTVSQTNGVVGDTHNHAIGLNQFGHNHGMAHTHSTPAHSHNVIFGILEIENTNGTIEVDINGVRRTGTTNIDIILDITTWITTNGIHNISLRSPNLKRIQCDVFIKSYIRR